jgi:hypothetical protein
MLQNPATDLQVQRAQKGAGNSPSLSRSKAGKCVPVSHVNGGVLGPGSNRCVSALHTLGQEPRDRVLRKHELFGSGGDLGGGICL